MISFGFSKRRGKSRFRNHGGSQLSETLKQIEEKGYAREYATTERFTRLAATSRLRRERLTIGSQKHRPTLSPDNDVNIVLYSTQSSQTPGKWDIRRN